MRRPRVGAGLALMGAARRWIFGVCVLVLPALAACSGLGHPDADFPMPDRVACDVAGLGCRPDCNATPIPSPAGDRNAVSFQIGAPTCRRQLLSDYLGDARRQARQACHDRGMRLASSEPRIVEQPAVGPLAPAVSVTFVCQP